IVRRVLSASLFAAAVATAMAESPAPGYRTVGQPLPGTRALEMPGDLASLLVDGADRFLDRKLEESTAGREMHWARDFSSAEAYAKSIEPQRVRLAHILGVRDPRDASTPMEVVISD